MFCNTQLIVADVKYWSKNVKALKGARALVIFVKVSLRKNIDRYSGPHITVAPTGGGHENNSFVYLNLKL